jgi:hypothetical protein
MRKKKRELFELLEEKGLSFGPKITKKEAVALLLAPEAGAETLKAETDALRAARQEVEGKKYSTEMPPLEAVEKEVFQRERAPEIAGEVPAKYGEDRITAIVRDPYCVFVYWEITPASLERARAEFAASDGAASLSLRVYDITDKIFDGKNANSWFDIASVDAIGDWYINTAAPGRSYCVEAGLLDPAGEFHCLARSNPVSTPRAGMSDEVDARWMTRSEEFERIYALSGGLLVGESSPALHEMMQKQLEAQLASEAAASMSGMTAPPSTDK